VIALRIAHFTDLAAPPAIDDLWRTAMHRFSATFLLVLLASLAPPARAEIFCVHDAAEFFAALTAAGINQQDDEIRLRKGTYLMANGVYEDYNPSSDENFDLDISGGWYQRATAPCGAQSDNPWETVLDGEGAETVLRLNAFELLQASVSVRLLTFMNGFQSIIGITTAGGLDVEWGGLIGDEPTAGAVSIERNVFLLDDADYALAVGGGYPRVTNNLFLLNGDQEDGFAAYLFTTDLFGSTFTNNTVIGNGGGVVIYGRGEVINNNFRDNAGTDVTEGDFGDDFFVYNNNLSSIDVAADAFVEDNISVEPEYQGGLFNYTPVRNSPLVDAGREPQGALPLWYLTDVDLNDSPRRVGTHVDIGAFENEKIFVNGFDPQGPF
jgi:hypothetical protein